MKPMKTHVICLALVCAILLPAGIASAQDGSAVWSIEARIKRLVESHTSYEFGNPDPPYQAPLSRLEFALDSWWGGVEIARRSPKWSVSLELLTNLSTGVDGQLQDSDWTNPADTSMRDIYSESDLSLNRSYMFDFSADVSLTSWLSLPKGLDLRPVGGVRWQFFDFTASDGTQWETLPSGAVDIVTWDQDVIDFEQTYWHFYAGMRMDLQPSPEKYPDFKLKAQVDLAYVHGENWDHHLLRLGYRITEESTDGYAWHAKLGLEGPIAYGFSFDLSFDYMYIDTSGNHFWSDSYYGVEEDWNNGVEVWSQQMSLSAAIKYCF